MANRGGASLDPLRFPQRKSVRLEGHNYSSGTYFITICVHGRRPLLSTIVEGEVLLSPVGNILVQEWLRTPGLRPDVLIDVFVVMPDHFHGVVMLDPVPIPQAEPPVESRAHAVRPYDSRLARFVAGFKSSCTRQYREMTGCTGAALWQRGFYEHVVRGLPELERIRRYITNNPLGWNSPPTETPVGLVTHPWIAQPAKSCCRAARWLPVPFPTASGWGLPAPASTLLQNPPEPTRK